MSLVAILAPAGRACQRVESGGSLADCYRLAWRVRPGDDADPQSLRPSPSRIRQVADAGCLPAELAKDSRIWRWAQRTGGGSMGRDADAPIALVGAGDLLIDERC